ncbi:hypothetical conserved protein [Candidatus Nitrosoglobus terrae]|uniref:Hypothetical conserved protein n=1 Tax=Candidatus Nitrosoglobus terrae TaxID=1630141 RepID=A0A1Q2SNM7_9GAMM|nr:hypothetical conserved protein [Candidatus Nitrosoglobus terrae]
MELGEIEIKSKFNQPLRAEITLRSIGQIPLENIQIGLASSEEFLQAGIDRAPVLSNKLHFHLVHKDTGEATIEVSSQDLIQDPFLNFLAAVVWPRGRLLREYTVLFDLPIPEEQLVFAMSDLEANDNGDIKTVNTSKPKVTLSSYGPVKPVDTLSLIAQRLLQSRPSVSLQQMMIGLQRANPSVFIHNNINGLKAGEMLNVPTEDEVLKLTSTAEAIYQVQQQNQIWESLSSNRKLSNDTQFATLEELKEKDVLGKDEAKILADESEDLQQETMPEINEDSVADLQIQLLQINEALNNWVQENEKMQTRLQEMEQQVSLLQNLLLSKDELADPPAVNQKFSSAGSDLSSLAKTNANLIPESKRNERDLESIFNRIITSINLPLLSSGISILFLLIIIRHVRQRKALKSEVNKEVNWSEPATDHHGEISKKIVNPTMQREVYTAATSRESTHDLAIHPPLSVAENIKVALEKLTDSIRVKLVRKGNILSPRRWVSENIPQNDKGSLQKLEVASSEPPSNVIFPRVVFNEESIAPLPDTEGSLIGVQIAEPDNETLEITLSGEGIIKYDVPVRKEEVVNQGEKEKLEVEKESFISVDPPFSLLKLEEFQQESQEADSVNIDVMETGSEPEKPYFPGQALIKDLDEIEIKLNLARAYIDMNDTQGASNILQEVIAAGNEEQQNIGKELLVKLAKAS